MPDSPALLFDKNFCFRFKRQPCKSEVVSMRYAFQGFPLQAAADRVAQYIPMAAGLRVNKLPAFIGKAQLPAIDKRRKNPCGTGLFRFFHVRGIKRRQGSFGMKYDNLL